MLPQFPRPALRDRQRLSQSATVSRPSTSSAAAATTRGHLATATASDPLQSTGIIICSQGFEELLFNVQIPQPKVDVEALYQKPKKQRRHPHQQQQIRVEKIEEEPEVKGDRTGDIDSDSNRVNCGAQTTPTVKAPEGMATAAARARQQRLAPLAEQVESAKLIETYSIDRGNFCPISPLSFIHLFRSRPTRPSLPPPSVCVRLLFWE